jgi:hypothetical protein
MLARLIIATKLRGLIFTSSLSADAGVNAATTEMPLHLAGDSRASS